MGELTGARLGNCHLLRRIGSGGMGDVYLAEQLPLGRQVVVKVLRETASDRQYRAGEHATDDAATAGPFLREARAIAALDHPHILPLYDYGQQDGLHYLVMPYLPDGSLGDMLAPGAQRQLDLPLAPPLAIELIRQCADALQFVHDQGIIHRDVKPDNLLMRRASEKAPGETPRQSPPGATAHSAPATSAPALYHTPTYHIMLADFGLARFIADRTEHMGTAGTPLYSAPEQYEGRPVPASDQYALACVTFLLLTGRSVFEGSFAELQRQHLYALPSAPSRLNPLLPPALDAALLKALAKHPAQRYARVEEYAQALQQAALSDSSGGGGLQRAARGAPAALVAPASAQGAYGASPLLQHVPQKTRSLPPASPAPDSSPVRTPTWSRAITEPAAHPQLAAPAAAGGAVWGASLRRGPDAPGAALPSHMPRRHRPHLALVALACAVAITLALVSAYIRFGPLAAANSAGDTINATRSGVVDVRRLSPLRGEDALSAQSLAPRRRVASPPASDTASLLANLPARVAPFGDPSVSTPTTVASGAVLPQQRFDWPAPLATAAPLVTSIAAHSGTVLIAADASIHIRSDTAAQALATFSAASFFAPIAHPGATFGEPRALYDEGGQRWILALNEVQFHGAAPTQSYLDLGVSHNADPLGGWAIYQFSAQPQARDGGAAPPCEWGDFPQLGDDAAAFYITENRFQCGASGAFVGVALYIAPRQSLFSATSAAAAQALVVTGFYDANHQPVFTLTPAVESATDTSEWFMSNDASMLGANAASRQIILWTVTNEAMMSAAQAPALVGAPVTLPLPYADPPALSAARPGAGIGDARPADLRFSSGHLYAAFTTAVNWVGDTHPQMGVYWLDLSPALVRRHDSGPPWTIPVTIAQASIAGFVGGDMFAPVLLPVGSGNLTLVAEVAGQRFSPDLAFTSHHQMDPPGVMSDGLTLLSALTNAPPGGSALAGAAIGGALASPAGAGAPVRIWIAGHVYSTTQPPGWRILVAQLSAA